LIDEEHKTCVGTTITAVKAELIDQALKRNVDLFAWTTLDMPRVSPDIITHKLSVYKEARPIAQKKHKLGEEKKLVAKEGIKKLLSVELIRKSRYTSWLANVVMVTKTNIIMPQGFSKHPRDKEKTAFMTNDANYYYEVMSFDLKNAEATYQ